MLRIRVLLSTVVLLASMPLVASAEDDPQPASTLADSGQPTATCVVQPLPTRGLESSVARITCRVINAPATETSFTVRAALDDPPAGFAPSIIDPFCTATIADGAGECTGVVRDVESLMSGRLSMSVTLQPSGTLVGIAPPSSPAPS